MFKPSEPTRTERQAPAPAASSAAADPRAAILAGLTPAQAEAATHDGPILVLAGAGTGKTRTLVAAAAWRIGVADVPAHRILAVTFTNKAANEMRERLTKLIGKEKTSQLKLGTFHSICARYLRQYAKEAEVPDNFTVCDANERCAPRGSRCVCANR